VPLPDLIFEASSKVRLPMLGCDPRNGSDQDWTSDLKILRVSPPLR